MKSKLEHRKQINQESARKELLSSLFKKKKRENVLEKGIDESKPNCFFW
jgi:hypothetical protein